MASVEAENSKGTSIRTTKKEKKNWTAEVERAVQTTTKANAVIIIQQPTTILNNLSGKKKEQKLPSAIKKKE